MGITGWVIVAVVVALIVLLVVAMISSKNKFAVMRNMVEESWRQIDVELQRRHDLIGNLVEVVKASAQFEQQTLMQVVQARSQAVAAHGAGPMAQGKAEQNLNGTLQRFFHAAEAYPTLQANQDFRFLQQQMVETEDRIAAGRRFYNGNVRTYNTKFDTFPSSMFSSGHNKAQYFEVDDPQVRAAPSLRGAFDGMNNPQQFAPQQQFSQQQPFPQQQPQLPPQQQPGQTYPTPQHHQQGPWQQR